MTTADAVPAEMQALKVRLKATWESGDYGVFARYLEPGALSFLARLKLQPGESMLDLACGAGQLAIPAARAGVDATGLDLAANLIAQARQRAADEHLNVRFDEGDAEALPYRDASFGVVSSLVGIMFAPRPERVVAELLRVTRPGGRIVLGNWTPEGFIGGMFKVMGRHVPPSPLMPSPMRWGDEATVRERLGAGVKDLHLERIMYPFVYPFGPEGVVDFFRTYYGPTNRAFAVLGESEQAALRADLIAYWTEHNQGGDAATRLESELLVASAVRV